MRRLAARNISCEVPLATAEVSYDEDYQNDSKKLEEENAKLLCYKKFKSAKFHEFYE